MFFRELPSGLWNIFTQIKVRKYKVEEKQRNQVVSMQLAAAKCYFLCTSPQQGGPLQGFVFTVLLMTRTTPQKTELGPVRSGPRRLVPSSGSSMKLRSSSHHLLLFRSEPCNLVQTTGIGSEPGGTEGTCDPVKPGTSQDKNQVHENSPGRLN